MSDAQKYIPGLGTAFTFDKADVNMFVSAETTGTGSSQSIAHGLGVVPAAVIVVCTDNTGGTTSGAWTVTEGVHDATNVNVTVLTGKKFKVVAWA
jgi:hypothetical protein